MKSARSGFVNKSILACTVFLVLMLADPLKADSFEGLFVNGIFNKHNQHKGYRFGLSGDMSDNLQANISGMYLNNMLSFKSVVFIFAISNHYYSLWANGEPNHSAGAGIGFFLGFLTLTDLNYYHDINEHIQIKTGYNFDPFIRKVGSWTEKSDIEWYFSVYAGVKLMNVFNINFIHDISNPKNEEKSLIEYGISLQI